MHLEGVGLAHGLQRLGPFHALNQKKQMARLNLEVLCHQTRLLQDLDSKRSLMENGRTIIVYKDPGRYIPIMFLLYSWGSLFGVHIKVPLDLRAGEP